MPRTVRQEVKLKDGKTLTDNVSACKGPNGNWDIVRSRRAALRLASLSLLAVAAAGGAAGEPVKGQSRELGIHFEVRGGENWCGSEVGVDLTADKADAIKPDTLPFVRMAGRIRAVVIDQCRAVERIVFHAAAPRRPGADHRDDAPDAVARPRACRYRDAQADMPAREPEATDCAKRAEAYFVMHRIMRGEPFAEAELTTVLDDQEAAHAVWVAGGVVGKLTIKDRGELGGRYAASAQLGDAITAGVAAQCGRDGGSVEPVWAESWFAGSEREVAVRGISCRPRAGKAAHHAILVTQGAGRFHVLALLADQGDAEAARTAARQLALAIGSAP